jgi:signal transduction histidine kinase
VSLALIPLLFPDGRPPSRRWHPVVWIAAGAIVLGTVSFALMPGPLESYPSVDNPFGIEGTKGAFELVLSVGALVIVVTLFAGIASLVVRYRRSRGAERQQLKWFTYAAALVPFALLGDTLFPEWAWLIGGVGVACIPVAIGIAILRYRLYDIDLVINRTLVYGALTACVVGIYVLIVGYLGAVFRTGNLAISLAATGVVAVLFAPLRDLLQRGVNRLMYGERDDPYAVLSRPGQRLEAIFAPAAVLPTAVRTVAESLKLPYAAVEVERSNALEIAAATGKPVGDPLRLPLHYGGETVGRLVLGRRAGEAEFGPLDRRLLDDLTRQIGVAVHAARLTDEAIRLSADLQRSRERLVTAREEERRRLRRDLHDGLGPQLASLAMKAEAARDLLSSDPASSDALLEDITAQTQEAVTDIRRLVYGLRPPALDDLGLTDALKAQAAHGDHGGLRVSVETPDSEALPPLPAAVEVAAYRIAQEAVTNAARHAGARNCTVRISPDEEAGVLRLEVTDDGRGIPVDRSAGIGLASMRERAAELGGACTVEAASSDGTRVVAVLPLAPFADGGGEEG